MADIRPYLFATHILNINLNIEYKCLGKRSDKNAMEVQVRCAGSLSVLTRWTRAEMDVVAKWGALKKSKDRSGCPKVARDVRRTAGTKLDVGHGREQGRTGEGEDGILSWEIRQRDCR